MPAITVQDCQLTFSAIIITGSRHWSKPKPIKEVLFRLVSTHKILRFAHGNQKGADSYGAFFAEYFRIPTIKPYDADWSLGKKAGPLRNMYMLDSELEITARENILVIAFPLPQSIGTYDMINYAKHMRVNVQIYDLNGDLTFELIQKFV